MKLVLRIASYLLVLTIGLGAGYYIGYGSKFGPAFAFDILESSYYSAYVDMQMSEGTDAAKEEAIRTFLALTEKRRERPMPQIAPSVLALDSALAYARLAALAERRGATQEAEEHLARAKSYCPQIGWRECSIEKITYFASRLDKHGVFGTEGSK
jgi:hypothetical protein